MRIFPIIAAGVLVTPACLAQQVSPIAVQSSPAARQQAISGDPWREILAAIIPRADRSVSPYTLAHFASYLTLNSPHYEDARALALALLRDTEDTITFEQIFAAVTGIGTATGRQNDRLARDLSDALNLNRALLVEYQRQVSAAQALGKEATNNPDKEILQSKDGRRIRNPAYTYQQRELEIELVDRFLAQVLVLPRAGTAHPDMSHTALWNVSFFNANLASADLSNAGLNNVSIEGADLSGISDFGSSSWSGVAWWKAARISPRLLEYLITNFPWSKDAAYFESDVTEDEYKERITLLSGPQAPK